MFQILKNLFAAIFGKKKITPTPTAIIPPKALTEKPLVPFDQTVKQAAEELTKVRQVKESKKWRMRNNRLLIQYNANCFNHRMNGKMQSMRCTRLERAREIASGIQSYCVRKIVFADQDGQQFIITSN